MKKEATIPIKIAIFQGKKVRKIIFQNEWWFSVVDVVEALTDSVNARDYWFKMKIRVKGENGVELSTFCRQLIKYLDSYVLNNNTRANSNYGEFATLEMRRY